MADSKRDYHERHMERMADEDDMGDGDGMYLKEGEVREQDRYLPIANIARIMKTVLPGNAKIAKDAKESIQECVSEFISFITSEASDKCQQEKRKTINGDDLLWAMSTLGFDKYIDPLRIYLTKYRESVKGEKPDKKMGGGGGRKMDPMAQAQPKAMGMGMVMGGNPNSIMSGNLLPLMSDFPGYNPYDSAGGSLLMGGSLEDSPLFLASGSAPGKQGEGILPPLPKKRGEQGGQPQQLAAPADFK